MRYRLVLSLMDTDHADHSRAAKDIMKATVDIYTSQGTADALKLNGHRLHIIKAHQQFKVGSWTILPFDTIHDAPEPLGFILSNGKEKILYVTDTCYIPYRFKGLTHVLVECNYATDILNRNRNDGTIDVEMKRWIVKNHMSLATVKEFLLANDLSRVREIHLLHLSDRNSDADRIKREIQGITGKEVYVAEKAIQ